jgi:hypothetical protein
MGELNDDYGDSSQDKKKSSYGYGLTDDHLNAPDENGYATLNADGIAHLQKQLGNPDFVQKLHSDSGHSDSGIQRFGDVVSGISQIAQGNTVSGLQQMPWGIGEVGNTIADISGSGTPENKSKLGGIKDMIKKYAIAAVLA